MTGLGVSFLSLVMIFALLEGAVRWLGLNGLWWTTYCQYDETLGWVLAPGREGRFWGNGFSTQVEVSPQGLRDRTYPYDRRDGRKRILVLGDSFVWCWGVEMHECFTEILESRLIETEVIAMGVPGYGTDQELLLYERTGVRFQPDLVLLVFVANDPFENLAEDFRPRFRFRSDELVLANAPLERRLGPFLQFLTDRSALCAFIDQSVQIAKRRYLLPALPELEAEAFKLTDALLDRLHERVRAGEARFAIVLERLPRDLTDHLTDYCGSRGIPCLDLEPRLDAAEARRLQVQLGRDAHRSADGHLVVADSVLAFLREKRLLAP